LLDIGDPGPGVARAWEILSARKPQEVCTGARVRIDRESGAYVIESFGCEYLVNTEPRSVTPRNTQGLLVSERLAYFFLHSVVWYLGHALDFPDTGRLVKPEGLKGGANFFTGAHALPLPEIAARYNPLRGGFLEKGLSLGGVRADYADESVTLRPLPGVSACLLLWYGDDEFEPRADLLFDSSIEVRLPLDVIWSVAMMTTLAVL